MTAIKKLVLGLIAGAFVFSVYCDYFTGIKKESPTPEQQWAREFINLAHRSI